MIDTDKMRAAFAATPLCQSAWTKRDGDGNSPTMLCAISALVSFAGVQPELIRKMDETEVTNVWSPAANGNTAVVPRWVSDFALPVLRAEYNIPRDFAVQLPVIFDRQQNEWKGVQAVLDLCEKFNMDERHAAAIAEDRERYPEQYPANNAPWTFRSSSSLWMGTDWVPAKSVSGVWLDEAFGTTGNVVKQKLEKVPHVEYKSQYWTAPAMPEIAKKHTGKLMVGK